MIYKDVYNGNNVITLIAGVRNSNTLRIHSNSIGKTIFETDNIYDTDFLKIIMMLSATFYLILIMTNTIMKKLKKF